MILVDMDGLIEYDVGKLNLSIGAVKIYFKNNYNVYFNKRTCAYDIWCNGTCILSNMAYEEVQSYFEKMASDRKRRRSHTNYGLCRCRSLF